jgi:DNA polymerase-3 subunit gamma/tau
MAYLALYRKYRPTTFENLIGQEHIVKTLANQIVNDRIGHAYLFTGTRGTGKTSAAKIFAKAINCLNPKNGSPCGECEVCKTLSDPSNIDVVEIDAASNNGVNEIRDLREKVQYPPVSCKYKVYIIDEVHMLTGAAFNALLKTLEEPPKHAVFILATTEVHKIPATILSRCMRFDFHLISTEQIAKLISDIYDEQGKTYEKEAILAIAKAGEGSIRDALSIADIAISYSSGALTYDDTMEILGSSNEALLNKFINALLSSNAGAVLQVVDELSALGKSMGVLVRDVTSMIRDILVVKTCANANSILGLPAHKFNDLKALAETVPEERLLRIMTVFSDAESVLKYSNHPRIIFETAAVKASRPDSDYNLEALLARVKQLEDRLEKGALIKQAVVEGAPTPVVEAPKKIKQFIYETTEDELKGKVLLHLRKINSEMLWNVFQTVKFKIDANTLKLTAQNKEDFDFLESQTNKIKIVDALSEYQNFDLVIKLSEAEQNLEAVDQATERMKKIFGDNIVIIK